MFKSPFRRTAREDGFTLVELMITIIIFGLLAAVAVPIFLNQRSDAIRSQIRSDVHAAVENTKTALVGNPTATNFEFYRSSNAPLATPGMLEVRVSTQSSTMLKFTGPVKATENPTTATTTPSAVGGYTLLGTNPGLSGYYYYYNSILGEYYDNSGNIDRSWDSKS